MVHQPNGKESAWISWVEGVPQVVGEVGRWLHPNLEMGGWMSRQLAEGLGGGKGGLEGIPRVSLTCPSAGPQCS